MLLLRLAALLTSVVLLEPVQAHAAHFWGPSGTQPTCPFGSAYADGCAGANQNSVFRAPSLYTWARQNGQPWSSPHPQPWNVAGADYPVGYDKSTVFKDPTVNALPSGCSYPVTIAGKNAVSCNFGGAGVTTIDGWDFTRGGTTCIPVYTTGSPTSLTITNNKFGRLGSNCDGLYLLDIQDGTFPVTVKWNVNDGGVGSYQDSNNTTSGADYDWADNRAGGGGTYQYNVYIRCYSRCVVIGSPGGTTMAFNLMVQAPLGVFVPPSNAPHFEMWSWFPGAGTIPNYDNLFNTLVLASQGSSNSTTGPIYITYGGATPPTLTEASISGNTFISNGSLVSGTLAPVSSAAVGSARIPVITTFSVTGNFIDPTNASGCWYYSPIASGIAFSQSVDTVTVTAVDTSVGTIQPGAILFDGGVGAVKLVIQPYGTGGTTGTGGTGTYKVTGDTNTRNVTGWQTTPAVTNFTWSGNVNMRDATAITFGTNATGSTGLCNGHF